MWYCKDCYNTFQMSENFIDGTCPYCKSGNIMACSDFNFPKMDGLVLQEGRDNFPSSADSHCSSLKDFVEAGLDEETIEYLRNNAVAKFPLSFDDLDVNEILLLGLPKRSENEVIPITYITEMNERFLHTFIDGSFIPA